MWEKIKQSFINSSLEKKLLMAGNLALIVSAFLPWYSDLDSRNIASNFNGVSGPLYVIGYFILLGGAIGLLTDLFELSGRKLNYFYKPHIQIAFSLQSLFLVVLSYSIYAHPKFGLGYVSTKNYHLGLFIAALASTSLAFVYLYDYYRKEDIQIKTHSEDDYHEEEEEYENNENSYEENLEKPVYRVERTQAGIETRVKTVVDSYLENNKLN